MTPPKITVAVPTYNRAALLKQTLDSILAQTGIEFAVAVFDNASTDDTEAVVRSFSDSRVSFRRSPENLGLVRNWNRCIEQNRSPYVCVFHDDDLMRDGFLAESLALLEAHSHAGFCYGPAEYIDHDGTVWGAQPLEEGIRPGVMDGGDFLEWMVAGRSGTIFPSSVVFRASALAEAGLFDSPHSKVNIDRNLYYRLARRFQVGFLGKHLIAAREHPGQETEVQFRAAGGPGMIGALAERLDAAAYLVETDRAADPAYRRWLGERLLMLHRRESDAIHARVPALYWNWQEQVNLAQAELDDVLPPDAGFILVDEDTWGLGSEFRGRRVWPFIEKDGLYWGAPEDEATAVAELRRLQEAGAGFIAFAWTAFWWLDHYAALDRRLRDQAERVLWSPRLMVFRLRD